MRKPKLTLSLLGLLSIATFAQEIEAEKTYQISRKSKRGFLAGIDYDADQKTYQLTYFTKQTQRKLNYEFYIFDNDFNMIKDIAPKLLVFVA
ncbi:MAG: hypothetical protein SNJ77_02345 [Cytophagales bacterium]